MSGGHTEAPGGGAEHLLVPGQVGHAVGGQHHGGVREFCDVL